MSSKFSPIRQRFNSLDEYCRSQCSYREEIFGLQHGSLIQGDQTLDMADYLEFFGVHI